MNGDIYEGEWMKDKNHGEGIIRFCKRKSLHICESKLDYNLEAFILIIVIICLFSSCLSKWKLV